MKPDLPLAAPVSALWNGTGSGHARPNALARNALERGGIRTVGDLVRRTARDLTDIRAFGTGCLEEVRRVLAAHGLALAGEAEAPFARGKNGPKNQGDSDG